MKSKLTHKKRLREHMLQRRHEYIANLGQKHSQYCSEKIRDFLLRVISPNQIIACYIPFREELNTFPIIYTLEQKSYRVALPVVNQENSLSFYQWSSTAPLEKCSWGFMVPSKKLKLLVPEIILVPLVAFDITGHRLGYGQGYYDRTVKELRRQKKIIAIGLAYDIQKIDLIPCESFDEKLDWIITEKQTYLVNSV